MVTQRMAAGEELTIEEEYLRAKRLLDVILTVLALIPASVVMLVTAVAIWIDSPGPIIFRQKRVGMNGCEFNLYKFRSMYHNVDSSVHQEATAHFIRGG
ncbi:MAG: sugar transferase, partial [Ktedonobacterales bacterium]